MANEEVIRQQMEETRTSLTEKLETLENQVVQTVQGATDAVKDTVATVKDSVEETVTTVKDTVEGTVCAVKETVSGSVETVKEYMDVRGYVEDYPWLMMGGAVALGYFAGAVIGGGRSESFKASELSKASDGHRDGIRPQHRNGGHGHKRRHEASALSSWLPDFGPELNKLKGLALGAMLGTIREMVTQSLPGQMGDQLRQIVDNVTTKLGGEPVASSDLQPWVAGSKGGDYGGSDQAKMGGSLGSAHRQGPQTMGRFER